MSRTVTSTKENSLDGPDHSVTERGQCPAQHTQELSKQQWGRGQEVEGERNGGYSNLKFSEKSSHTTHLEAAAKESLSFLINTSEIAFLVQNKERER